MIKLNDLRTKKNGELRKENWLCQYNSQFSIIQFSIIPHFLDVDFFDVDFLDADFFDADFLGVDFLEADFFEEDPLDFFGTFDPFSRASESPMAIACFLLLTFFPLFPLFNLPFFISCIASSTES